MWIEIVSVAMLAGAGASMTPAEQPGRSWEEAESLRRKLAELQQGARQPAASRPVRPGTVVVTQGEINSYVNLVMQSRLPVGLRDVDLELMSERVRARGTVDLDQVRAAMNVTSMWNPLALLSGQMPVELTGRLKNEAGFGTFEFEEIRLGPMPVSPSLLHRIVAAATRTPKNPQGFDILAPFRLPYALKRVRFQPGRALLEL